MQFNLFVLQTRFARYSNLFNKNSVYYFHCISPLATWKRLSKKVANIKGV
jgi:hypothetical protein